MEEIRTEVKQNDAAGKRDAGVRALTRFSIKPIWVRVRARAVLVTCCFLQFKLKLEYIPM